MRCSLEKMQTNLSGEKIIIGSNQRMQWRVPEEKQVSQRRWKEGHRKHPEEWDGLHGLKENEIMCVPYQSEVKTS